MRTTTESYIDLGVLGERFCHISADITENHSYDDGVRYDVENFSITVVQLGDLDVADLLRTGRDEYEQELISIYAEAAREARASRGIERFYAARADRLSSLLGVA